MGRRTTPPHPAWALVAVGRDLGAPRGAPGSGHFPDVEGRVMDKAMLDLACRRAQEQIDRHGRAVHCAASISPVTWPSGEPRFLLVTDSGFPPTFATPEEAIRHAWDKSSPAARHLE